MAHVRKQIRDYVATLLTGFVYDRFGIVLLDRSGSSIRPNYDLLPTGSIYKSRHYALDDDKLPAIIIYTENATSSLATIGSRVLMHDLELRVDVINKGLSTTIFEDVEQFGAEIVEAIQGNDDFGGLVKDCVLTSMETDTNSAGDRTMGIVQLRFDVQYRTAIDNCEVSV
jgi:hypothetical protein